jgi:ABC-type transporter Mla MlaB component
MLRIHQRDAVNQTGQDVIRIALAGQLRDRWVDELRRLSQTLVSAGNAFELDLSEVSFVDAQGLQLLRELVSRHVPLINSALFVAAQLETLEQDV